MSARWVIRGFRRAFLEENAILLILRLLRDSELSEWEVLDSLYSRYRLAPERNDFHLLLHSLVDGGFARYEEAEDSGRLNITRAGVELLHALEDEYRAVMSTVQSTAPDPLTR